MTEETLQNAIATWLAGVITGLMVGNATPMTERTSGQPVLLWHMQEMGRFKTPLLMGRISAVTAPGHDSFEPPYITTVHSVNYVNQRRHGDRNFMLYLQYFGNTAFDQLSKVKTVCYDSKKLDTLRAGGCTVIRAGTVLEAHAFLGTMPEDRAMLDLEMRTYEDETQVDQITVVEHAKINGKVNDVSVKEISV